MEKISQQEIEAVEGFLTFSMVRDAGNVMKAHRAVAESLFTGKVTCACGHVSRNATAWRHHVCQIILVRHTALMARYAKKENWSKEVMPE